jgi:hypothetical protein
VAQGQQAAGGCADRFAANSLYYLAIGALVGGVTLWAFRGLLGRLGSELIGVHNDVIYAFSTMRWQWHVLATADFAALLDAPLMAPIAHGHAFGDNLLALTLLGAPVAWAGQEVLAYNLALLATFVLTGVCGAGFGRALSGSRAVGLTTGLACAFFPIRFGTLYHVNNLALMGAALALWAVVRWLDTRAWAWAVLVAVGAWVQFLCSIQLFVFLALMGGVWLFGRWGTSGFALRAREVAQVAVALAIEAVLLVPWLGPYLDARQYVASARSTDEVAQYRAPLGDWLSRLAPGAVVAALMVVAALYLMLLLVPRWRRATWAAAPGREHLPWLVGLSLVGVALSLGPVTDVTDGRVRLPYYWLMEGLPFFDAVRVPQRVQRVSVLLMCGAAAVTLAWLMGLVIQWLRWRLAVARLSLRAEQGIRGGVAVALGVLICLQVPEVKEPMRPLPRQSYAAAIADLPGNAVVHPVPLTLNWPQRPPLDLVAVETGRRFVGGYGSTIPDLFWVLARRASRFPEPEAVAAVQATGATHVLVSPGLLSPVSRQRLSELGLQGATLNYQAGGFELWRLGEAKPRIFEPFAEPATSFTLTGPARVATGQLVTLALATDVTGTWVDGVVERHVAVETLDADGRLVDAQAAALVSPMLVEGRGMPYRILWRAPKIAGRYGVRILWPPCPPCRDRGALGLVLEVEGGLATSKERAAKRYSIVEVARPAVALRSASLPLRLRIQNDDDMVFLATSDDVLPANAGQMVFHVMIRGKQGGPQLMRPFEHHQALPRDLAPGEAVDTTLEVEAPGQPGEYTVVVRLGSYQLGPVRQNKAAVLAPPFVVE